MVVSGRVGERLGASTKMGYAVFVVLIILAIFFVDPVTLEERTEDLPLLGDVGIWDPDAGSGRVLIWQSVIDGVQQGGVGDWLIGQGLYASMNVTAPRLGKGFVAHNSMLEVFVNQGAIGLIAYVWLIGSIIYALLRASRMRGEVGVAAKLWGLWTLVVFVVAEMFLSLPYELTPRWMVFFVVGSILAESGRSSNGREGVAGRM
jgi:O-antigen ligase